MLVLESAGKHQNFLAAGMSMRLEVGSGRPAHQGRVACLERGQRHHAETGDETGLPMRVVRIHNHPLPVVRQHLPQLHENRSTRV